MFNTRPSCGHILCILVGTTLASQKCGQILEKACCAVYKVPLTKKSLWAPPIARNDIFYAVC